MAQLELPLEEVERAIREYLMDNYKIYRVGKMIFHTGCASSEVCSVKVELENDQ